MMPNYLQTEFDKILDREYFSKEVHPLRKMAYDNLLRKGLPNKKCEDWRFTDLSAIRSGDFRISEIGDGPKKDIRVSDHGLESLDTIVIYNGHFQKNISSVPEGITLLSNIDYMKNNGWSVEQPEMTSFDLLNSAFMDSGVSLVIKEKTNIEVPLRILFICSGNDNIMITPRIHLDLGESSSLTLVEQHEGNCDEYFYNGSMIVNIEDDASLDHVRIQNNSKKTINMCNLHVQQNSRSNYSFSQFAFGGILGRINLNANLIGEGVNCSLNGLSLSNDKQHSDAHVITNHHAAHCTSSQNFKSILKDRSSGVFNGRSIVHEGAEKTDSSQSNNNLLLSQDALMNSNPQLEIYTDDVKCSHGSTTGALESDALFYVQSRGIDETSARELLVRGFASEIIDMIRDNEIRDHVIGHFDTWLNGNDQ